MIEVLALAGAVTKVAGAVSSAVKAGSDVADLLPHFGKLAKLDSEIQLAEKGKHKGPLGRLSSSEEEGFAIAQAKMKHKEAMDELRSACQLYGPPGMARPSNTFFMRPSSSPSSSSCAKNSVTGFCNSGTC